jgi:hypothetical protein
VIALLNVGLERSRRVRPARIREEKRRAFEALAMLIERIVNPQPSVVPLERHRR